MNDPIGQLLSFSGLTFYGGLIFGAISVYALKNYGIKLFHLIDSFIRLLYYHMESEDRMSF